MPMAAGMASPKDRAAPPPVGPTVVPVQTPPVMVTDAFAKDAILAWFRGEFAAANAVIDALCSHLAQLSGGPGSERVTEKKFNANNGESEQKREVMLKEACLVEEEKVGKKVAESMGNGVDEVGDGGEVVEDDDSPDSDITDSGSQEVQPTSENIDICSNHEGCNVNVVKGLKLYEDVFTDYELSKLTDFVNELRVAGQNGDLAGETFILFNKQVKGNKRELVQFGIPIFGHIKEEATSDNRTSIIIHMLHSFKFMITTERKSLHFAIVQFYQDEYSQPFQKPPHLDQPISTLLLAESTMAFGRTLLSDNDGIIEVHSCFH
ncbi:hypothetical protein GH714_037178 [Hevea brasiliensis]|uniref:Uncharacterized protein n=1 Tax=Hevea brasiliensis TaxID=3981 RepID=A0A6A6MMD8_HEVBR|nr:hypothetical protein GH714_037178 [Hevea brasiliensis]